MTWPSQDRRPAVPYPFQTRGQPRHRAWSVHDVRGLAVDAAGNVFVADGFNHRLQMLGAADLLSPAAHT